jgi:hypothetical protein
MFYLKCMSSSLGFRPHLYSFLDAYVLLHMNRDWSQSNSHFDRRYRTSNPFRTIKSFSDHQSHSSMSCAFRAINRFKWLLTLSKRRPSRVVLITLHEKQRGQQPHQQYFFFLFFDELYLSNKGTIFD